MTLSRRDLLRAAALAALGPEAPAADKAPPAWHEATIGYLDRLARPDGGYAWDDQEASHITPTYAVIGAYQCLGRTPPNAARLAAFVREAHPARLRPLEQEHREFDFQQVQALVWLGEDASSFRQTALGWTRPKPYLRQYERHGHPVFRFQLAAFFCRALLGLPLEDLSPHFTGYLDARRRENGSFNNTPATDGGDGHVMNTLWGLQALATLGRAQERKDQTTAWLRACQRPRGGFTHRPDADLAAVEDVSYTRAAVRALALLNAGPADRAACLRSLGSLRDDDGGFGNRPGWPSNPLATFHALDALAALDATRDPLVPPPRRAPRARSATLPDGLHVFSAQVEAHGAGSPADAVRLAEALRIHLWMAKNPAPGWVDRAQRVAKASGAPVAFHVASEEYGTWIDFPGLGTYSHMSDLVAPAGADFGASLAGPTAVTWPEFRERRLGPLRKAGGRLVWQFGENEELVRLVLDDSIERGGYAAISTFHFGNPDFTRTEPFLKCYRGVLPFIALQDAHGAEPWWFADMTTGFRTLFLATRPTWEGWLEALREDRVVAVRRDPVSGHRLWMHGGSAAVLEFVRQHGPDWRWWDNPRIARPLVSVVALSSDDRDEAGHPERGLAVRVRCARENTTQGLPRRPLAELVRLEVDGQAVAPSTVNRWRPADGPLLDTYHLHPLPDLTPGRHTARAVVRDLADGVESDQSIEFQAP